jgi:hypothetical protein
MSTYVPGVVLKVQEITKELLALKDTVAVMQRQLDKYAREDEKRTAKLERVQNIQKNAVTQRYFVMGNATVHDMVKILVQNDVFEEIFYDVGNTSPYKIMYAAIHGVYEGRRFERSVDDPVKLLSHIRALPWIFTYLSLKGERVTNCMSEYQQGRLRRDTMLSVTTQVNNAPAVFMLANEDDHVDKPLFKITNTGGYDAVVYLDE